jgi:predicted lipoprotein
MTSTQDLNSSIKTTNKNLTTQKEVLSNLLGLNYDNSSFLKSLEITPSGIITNPEIIPNEYRESLGANNVRDALSNIKALENQSENYKLLENSIKEELGTLKINPEKINDAFETVKKNIEQALQPYKNRIKISLVPNITNICYGRGVGYKIEEIVLPENIQKISATDIRKKMREEGKL